MAPCGALALAKMAQNIESYIIGASADDVAGARSNHAVLAVLPFDNPAEERDVQLFADGIAEEILLALSRVRTFRVIGRASVFQFRGARKTEAAHALSATHVLDGSVRRALDRIRVNAELCEVATGQLLWGERFDCDLADVFDMQDTVARKVASALD